MDLHDTLQWAASSDWAHYRPQPVIDAVNLLLPLGANGALDGIDTYLTTKDLKLDPQEGLFLVLRVLFEVPAEPGYHPPLALGGTSPPPPPDPRALPLFPLMLVEDVPILMVSGFTLAGDAPPVSLHVRHFREHGTIRSRPLNPSKSTSAVLDGFRTAFLHAYGRSPSKDEEARVSAQLL
jgi:hypothetical protein